MAKKPKQVIIWTPNEGPQHRFMRSREFEVLFGGSRGGGKANDINSLVCTPFGFKRMGDISRGDMVSNPDGSVSMVIGVYPQGEQDLYEIEFIDGAKTRVTEEHLWLAKLSGYKTKADQRYYPFNDNSKTYWRIYTTSMLRNHFERYTAKNLEGDKPHILIPLTMPVQFTTTCKFGNDVLRPLDPYLLGVLLGDGYLGGRVVSFASADDEIVDSINKLSGCRIGRGDGIIHYLHGAGHIRKTLQKMGLWECLSNSKFIPKAYKHSDIETRRAILCGLMDTDGYVDNRGHCTFTSVSIKLASDVQWIARSLGYKATITKKTGKYRNSQGEIVVCQDAHDVYIMGKNTKELFRLSRKRDRCIDEFNGGVSEPCRRITGIRHVGRGDAQCIKVSNPNGLYLTDDFIVTHNTEALIAYMTIYANNPNYSGLLLRRTFPQLLQVRQRCKKLYTKIDPGCHFNKDDNIFELSSGATIQLGHVQHDDDVDRYQGFQYQILGFEELTQFKEQHYEQIKLSCRSGDESMIPMVRATANPGGIGHRFVKKRFIDVGPPETVFEEKLPDGRVLTRKFIKSTVYDNPKILHNDPQYLAVLQNIQDPRLRAMMLEGDWDAGEGLFFNMFEREKHTRRLADVFPMGAPRDGMPIYASMDWGYSKPFAIYWHTIDRYDKIITFKEWYGIKTDPIKHEYMDNVGIQMIAKDVAQGFLQRCQGMRIEYLVVDPSVKAKSGLKGKDGAGSILEEFQVELGDAGIPVVLGNNNRKAGWMQMKTRLSDAPDGKPWWVVTDNCIHLIRTITTTPEEVDDPDDCDSDSEDHAIDSVRYFMMQFPLHTVSESLNRQPSNVIRLDQYGRGPRTEPSLTLVNTYH